MTTPVSKVETPPEPHACSVCGSEIRYTHDPVCVRCRIARESVDEALPDDEEEGA